MNPAAVLAPGRAEAPQPDREIVELASGWELAGVPAGSLEHPRQTGSLHWVRAQVPGTAAGALQAAGLWQVGDDRDFDAEDWWFRTGFALEPAAAGLGQRIELVLEGIATVAEVFLNGTLVLESDSMFATHRVDITELARAENELAIRCLALAPLLEPARRPRARWRTRLVSERNLRFHRTMLLGRTPGFAPGPAVVGPFKPVRVERRSGPLLDGLRLRASVQAGRGVLSMRARVGVMPTPGPALVRAATLELSGPDGVHRAPVALGADGSCSCELVVGDPVLWWPHTHGTPALYSARVVLELGGDEGGSVGRVAVDAGRVGFRTLHSAGDVAVEGIALRINGVPVFARGAVWTPGDLTDPCPDRASLRPVLEAVVAAGMNMLRVPGIATYESDDFHDLCDELGILVWQDFMFANLDYPDRDATFMEKVRAEATGVLARLAPRPSLAVLCGGSEVAQQAAMVGVDPAEPMQALFVDLLGGLVAKAEVEAPFVPNSPWGGDLPFRPGQGVANYYGVGAYLRPLEDARRAGVRFAAECLAFANVPDSEALEGVAGGGGPVVHDPAWKRGVPRDVGAGWDFEDVRDHYLQLLYGVDPVGLRWHDPERYLELSRAVSGEVMAEVFGEWRRAGSPCAGGLVLWLRDLRPGAGWGVLDHRGAPKAAYHHLRRALAPVAVWSTDEGLDGVAVHVSNDGPAPLSATLRVAPYRDRETVVEEVRRELELGPHRACSHNVEALLGRFVDLSWTYRFGPPAQDLIVFSLEDAAGGLLAQAVRHPAGRSPAVETAEQLGLSGRVVASPADGASLRLRARRFVDGVRVHVPGFAAEDDAFALEPGRERVLRLRPGGLAVAEGGGLSGHVTALNLSGRVALEVEP